MPSLGDRLKHAWNAFNNNDQLFSYSSIGMGSSFRPDRRRMTRGSERSIMNSIIDRISIDVAAVTLQHARLDQNGNFVEVINDGLNNVLTTEANIDQTSRAFMQDVVSSMLDEGVVALVPTVTKINPKSTSSYEILEARTGRVIAWYPNHVRLDVFDDQTNQRKEIVLPKRLVGIVQNPFYSVMNEPNSLLQRLIRKLVLLDAIDEQSGSGKLDLIIQLPYAIKGEGRRLQAENRRLDIEKQLTGSKYGIAYIDSTEHITQLNRAVENNLMKQVEYLTAQLYGQLGLTDTILNGTADEQTMLNYNNRTVEPIVSAIVDEMKRKFLTKTARSQGQSIVFFRDAFRLVPANNLAEIADKFTRNEILSPNEIRKIIGYKPVDDERADELRNRNLNESKQAAAPAKAIDPSESVSDS